MSNEKKSTKTLWQKINFLEISAFGFCMITLGFSVLIVVDLLFSTYITINLLITMFSYLGYPLYVVYKAQNSNKRYPLKKIKKIGIINAVIVWLISILLGGSGRPAMLWGWVAYDVMKNRIAIGEEENPEITTEVSNNIEEPDKSHLTGEIVKPFEMAEQPTQQKQTVKITVKRKSASKKADVSQEQVYSESPFTPIVDNEIKFCRKCGAKLEKGSIYCIKCGSKI